MGGGIPDPGCERSHWALDQSHSWGHTARRWGERGSDVILVRVDVENLMITHCVFLALTSPSTPLAPTPRIIWRTLHVGPMINDVPVSTIAWQPPMQPTALSLMVILWWKHSPTCLRNITSVWFGCTLQKALSLPVYGDLPVQLTGERNPGDGLVVVLGINATEGYHTTFKVSVQERQN